jgi:hypothetical protein
VDKKETVDYSKEREAERREEASKLVLEELRKDMKQGKYNI